MAKLLNYDRWFQKKYAVQLREFNELKLKLQIHCDENDVYFLVKEDGDGHISRILWEMIPVKEMSTEKLAEFSSKFFSALPFVHSKLSIEKTDATAAAEHRPPMWEWGIHVDAMYSQKTPEQRRHGQSIFQ